MNYTEKTSSISYKENGIISFIWQKSCLTLVDGSLFFHKNAESYYGYSLQIPLISVASVSRSDMKPNCLEVVYSRTQAKKQIKLNGNNGTVTTPSPTVKSVFIVTTTEQDMHDWIDLIFRKAPLLNDFSNPINFKHQVHVGFNSETGGFTGLPSDWERVIE
ncbi:hypothetical protein NCAS_0C04690 [Naumovozyma castellii]|uniref:non-specific serine/threonine protein kinase n=1 Tax=Naumovozyma castellii TaxID=27288 RepID=G0VD97_NAUCA|nr:hypothetical protein NCAS_0C04690 [Naumovozyma castellii CBS 4309]CCC69459.1 hypothetical protein NCAS_0C04690 [Naumovozyma castellii CBS 4309]